MLPPIVFMGMLTGALLGYFRCDHGRQWWRRGPMVPSNMTGDTANEWLPVCRYAGSGWISPSCGWLSKRLREAWLCGPSVPAIGRAAAACPIQARDAPYHHLHHFHSSSGKRLIGGITATPRRIGRARRGRRTGHHPWV
jgi:hypothetical protein